MHPVECHDPFVGATDRKTYSSPSCLADRFGQIRGLTKSLCDPLAVEDFGVQSMPEASPVKWHLAHTTWFFETFVLAGARANYQPFQPRYRYLFNSYYDAIGDRWPRERRGLLSRPTVAEVLQYRAHVDSRILALLASVEAELPQPLADALVLGLHHEQQHQELILTDIKHAFACNPLRPVYQNPVAVSAHRVAPIDWFCESAGVHEIGHNGSGFAFDNELPLHRQYLNAFTIANRLTTNGEYLAFMEDDGY